MTRPRYRPTYTPSETNRSLTRRLTPLAWICLVLLGLMIAGVLSLFAQQPGAYVRAQAGSAGPIAAEQGPAQIAPAPTLVPAIGPDPTNEGDVVRATAAAPAAASLEAPWAGAMRRLADGQIAAPAAASQAAREAVRQALERELALGRSGVSGADAVAGRAALLQATRILRRVSWRSAMPLRGRPGRRSAKVSSSASASTRSASMGSSARRLSICVMRGSRSSMGGASPPARNRARTGYGAIACATTSRPGAGSWPI